jgi:peptide/nickel transport system substrate-binding protein
MRRSKAYGAMALFAGAAVALSGCGSSSSGGGSGSGAANGPTNADPNTLALAQPYVRPKVPDAGTVTIAVDETMSSYNNNTSAANNIANPYIDNLVQPSVFFTNDVSNVTKVQVDGDLMASVKVLSNNPQTIQYNIKPQAVWSDGAQVDCADFYYQWLANPADDSPLAAPFEKLGPGLDHIGNLACSNNNKTVTATFAQPWADWQGLFSGLVPAHVAAAAAGITDDQLVKLKDTNAGDKATLLKLADFFTGGANEDHGFGGVGNLQNYLSAGPYSIKSSNGTSETVLVRNPKWWGNPGGPATIDIRTNTDSQSAYQQLQNKEIQIVGSQPDAQVAQEVNAAGGQIKLVSGIGQTFEHLDYNAKNAEFKKYPELRKALSLCVNRQDVINKVVADVDPDIKPLGMVLFIPTESAYVDHYANTGHGDVNAAKQVMTTAGWKLGSNGFFQKDGTTATITIGHKAVDRREATVQAIQAECKAAGIQVQDFVSDSFNAKNLPAGDYQVALFAWTGSPFKSGFDGIYQTGGGANYQSYSDTKVDPLMKAADGETDFKKRSQDLVQADQLIAQDGFTLPLFTLPEYALTDGSIVATGANNKTEPVSDNEASSGVLWNAFTWQKATS